MRKQISSREILKRRVERFQQLMKQNNIDASMVRTLSSFTYFTVSGIGTMKLEDTYVIGLKNQTSSPNSIMR